MKTRGIKDLYMPRSIALHMKIMLFCALFTPLWGLIINTELNNEFLLGTFLITWTDIEILWYIQLKINGTAEKWYRKSQTSLSQRKITLANLVVLAIFLIIAMATITFSMIIFFGVLYKIKGWDFPGLFRILNEIKGAVGVAAIGLSLSIPIVFYTKWQEMLKKTFELKEQNLIFQNETLKGQVNPHFLFNSLNTLSSLINTETGIANGFINKLSSIYRYIIDNSSKVKVPLINELGFVRDYYYLHQIRNEGKIFMTMHVSNESDFYIMPVSLQLLIENAIKHNMASFEKPLRIEIYVEEHNIVVKNNIQKMATQISSTKIGLKNLGERARLITGKEIVIEESASDFIVKVPLLS